MQIFYLPFGNLAHFHLGTWRIFIWELGVFSLENLEYFHLETWLFIPNITQKKIQTTQFGCLYFIYNNQKNYAL